MNNFRKSAYIAVAGTALGLGAVTAVPAAGELTVVSWGGAYTRSQVKAYHEPFTKETGIKINSEDYNGGLAQIKAQVESGNVTWDVVDLEPSDVARACDEGLLEDIDHDMLLAAPDGTPPSEDFLDETLQPCSAPLIIWSTVYAYDSSKFAGAKPATVGDFFDLDGFPGKRGLRKTPLVNMEWALMADGVPAGDVYATLESEEGRDRAFAKLDTIKASVVWWEAGAQPPQMLADGEVVMTSAYNGRLFNAIVKEKKPFVIVWDGQIMALDVWAIPRGAPNLEAALEFVKYSTSSQALAEQARWIAYGPARKSSIAMITTHAETGEPMAGHMPTAPANFTNALVTNTPFWIDNQDELNEIFSNWLAR